MLFLQLQVYHLPGDRDDPALTIALALWATESQYILPLGLFYSRLRQLPGNCGPDLETSCSSEALPVIGKSLGIGFCEHKTYFGEIPKAAMFGVLIVNLWQGLRHFRRCRLSPA